MKYIVILGDGMADEPLEALKGSTPLACARTPMMDQLAKVSEVGMVKTIPDGMKPGSDTANLSVLGYDPKQYYTGRSPLEALSIGVPMKDTDIALRCNVVTISEEDVPFEEQTIIDQSAGEIPTEEADQLIQAVKEVFQDETYQFYTGTSYRHLLIWNGGKVLDLTAPHDVLGQVIGPHLPEDPKLREMMVKSYDILNRHPVNLKRAAEGKRKANCLWFWGAGTKPILTSFYEKTGKKGAMVSAVDLLKGIATGAQMKVIEVPGADGSLHTNYKGKAMAGVNAVLKEGCDFAYIHLEAPDEMGHQGSIPDKITAIENLDRRIIRIVKEQMDQSGEDYRLLILPDHPTPIRCRTHTSDPVPYMLYDSTKTVEGPEAYNEKTAAEGGIFLPEGPMLMEKLFA